LLARALLCMPLNKISHGLWAAVAAFALFPSFHAIVKLLSSHYSIFQLMAYMSLAALFPVALMLLYARRQGRIRIARPGMVLMRAVISGLMAVCVFYALSKLPMSTAYSVQFSGPLFAAGLSTVVLGEKVGWKRWTGIAVGFCGILIILRPGITDFNTGYLASLAVAVLFACNAMILRTVGGGEPGGALVAAHVVGILGFSLPMLPSVYIEPDWPDLGWMFVTGLLMSSGHFFLVQALRWAPVSSVSAFQYTQLVWGLLFGVLLFDDFPDAIALGGAVMVVGSAVYVGMTQPSSSEPGDSVEV
jgi:S-adenosylmethionine uptake transporter